MTECLCYMLSRDKCPKHGKDEFISKYGGIRLDIGCGEIKRPNCIRLDKRKLDGIDIVHDLEEFPYPLPDECCVQIIGSHIIEHIRPEFTIDMFNELWRIMKLDGELILSTPYAGTTLYWQDPSHCNGFNQVTFQYFDPGFPLYEVYKPKPWKIRHNTWQANGILEVILEKMNGTDNSRTS